MTIKSARSDNEHTACVMIRQDPIAFTTEMTPKVDGEGIAFTIRSRDYKDAQCIAVQINGRTDFTRKQSESRHDTN